jgi:hypothetical protein
VATIGRPAEPRRRKASRAELIAAYARRCFIRQFYDRSPELLLRLLDGYLSDKPVLSFKLPLWLWLWTESADAIRSVALTQGLIQPDDPAWVEKLPPDFYNHRDPPWPSGPEFSRDRLIHEAMWLPEAHLRINLTLLRPKESMTLTELDLGMAFVHRSIKRLDRWKLGAFTLATKPDLVRHIGYTVRRYVCGERPAEIAAGPPVATQQSVERAIERVRTLLELPHLQRGAPRRVLHKVAKIPTTTKR